MEDSSEISNAGHLPKLITEYREPSYEEFETRTTRSLFNAFTHVLKDRQKQQPIAAAAETMEFQRLLCS
jgi:hypothetical protein